MIERHFDHAHRAVDEGVAGIIVSNHGARQLDGVSATLRALPEVVEAVDGRAEVMVDGGIRRGGDVIKALCLGARAVLFGRAYAYGLGAAGGPGVARSIEILRTDMIRTLKLLGCASIRDLDRSYIDVPSDWMRARQRQVCASMQRAAQVGSMWLITGAAVSAVTLPSTAFAWSTGIDSSKRAALSACKPRNALTSCSWPLIAYVA